MSTTHRRRARLAPAAMLALVAACTHPTARTFDDKPEHLTLRYPPGWHAGLADGVVPDLTSPRPLVAVATFEPPRTSARCEVFPLTLLQRIGARGALVVVYERIDFDPTVPGALNAIFKPRPTVFTPASGRDNDGSPDCPGTPSVANHRWIEFSDHLRAFQVYVGFGPLASPATHSQAWSVLNSLVVTP